MPWKNASILDERSRFIAECAEGILSITQVCRLYGISRKTGYKWMQRHAAQGAAGLGDQSRARREQGHAVRAEVEEWILAGRSLFPTWGPKKLVAWVRAQSGLEELCAVSTAGEILRRHGLSVACKRPRKGEPFAGTLVEGRQPNELWCVDFKGHFKVGDRRRCDPLTLSDAATRYLLKCQVLPNTGLVATRRVFEAAFREYGLPERIRSDNGAPFSSIGLGGLSALSLWWIKLGITPERIAPGKPYQNGRHERLHRTLKAETANPPAPTLRAQQRAFDRFRRHYNEERPHESLRQRPPASAYERSRRRYPGRVPSPSYEEGMPTRKIQSNGMFYWESARIFFGEAFAGETVAFAPLADGVWEVRFAHVALALFDERKAALCPLRKSAVGGRG
jgi:transposase InsO family protein